MLTTYKTVAGDTFNLISRKVYGTESEAGRIAKANPGTVEPLPIGVDLFVPLLQTTVSGNAVSNNPDEVAVLIDGVRFRFWSTIKINGSIDSFSTIELSAPFDQSLREVFRPLSFKPLVVTVGGSVLFTGTMIGVTPTIEEGRKAIIVSGYSRPGVLNDCTPPVSSHPLEFDGQGLRQIAESLAAPFGIPVRFIDSQGAIFDRVAANATQKIFSFFVTLASQRGLVITNNADGDLVFWKSINSGQPVAILEQGKSPLLSVTPTFNPQAYYSHITGLEPTVVGIQGASYTVKNKHVSGVLRPLSFAVPDTLDADVKQATETKAGRMFGSMVSYSVRVATWRDPSGNLWEPNTLINLFAPDAMIYNSYKFLIRAVELSRDRSSESATLTIVLPGAFNGQIPEVLPWDV